MISFYPGPSKIYPQVVDYIQEAHNQGVLSINHRSPEFMEICKNAIEGLKTKLNIPADYTILFVSSATEVWEIIAQSLLQKGIFHIYNGAFGKKWFEYTDKLVHSSQTTVHNFSFELNQELQLIDFQSFIKENHEIICLTHNETSNGTILNASLLQEIKQVFPEKLTALDATSSLGGVEIDFKSIDICYASVQKCLGLPAGLGLMILSPQAVQKTYEINERNHYNSLAFMLDNIQNWQTPFTPNVLNIYLLMRIMEWVMPIEKINTRLQQQAHLWYDFFENQADLKILIENPAVRSPTVITISATEEKIKSIKQKARLQNIILGNGYGDWKNTSFRVANFPTISASEIVQLQGIFN